MQSLKFLPLLCLLFALPAQAQSTKYGLGRTPTAEEIAAWDISISPITGEELPEGSGNADQGSELFMAKGCAGCHGTDGQGGLAPRLVKQDIAEPDDPWRWGRILPIRAPYATVVWDFINRGMPLYQEGTLTADEVYSLTAFLLWLNGIIDDDTMELNEENLPKIQMPNRDNWAELPEWLPGQPRLQGYPY